MKKNSKNTLAFKKRNVMELNDDTLAGINGGSSQGCASVAISVVLTSIGSLVAAFSFGVIEGATNALNTKQPK